MVRDWPRRRTLSTSTSVRVRLVSSSSQRSSSTPRITSTKLLVGRGDKARTLIPQRDVYYSSLGLASPVVTYTAIIFMVYYGLRWFTTMVYYDVSNLTSCKRVERCRQLDLVAVAHWSSIFGRVKRTEGWRGWMRFDNASRIAPRVVMTIMLFAVPGHHGETGIVICNIPLRFTQVASDSRRYPTKTSC